MQGAPGLTGDGHGGAQVHGEIAVGVVMMQVWLEQSRENDDAQRYHRRGGELGRVTSEIWEEGVRIWRPEG